MDSAFCTGKQTFWGIDIYETWRSKRWTNMSCFVQRLNHAKMYHTKNDRLIPTAKRGKEIKQQWNLNKYNIFVRYFGLKYKPSTGAKKMNLHCKSKNLIYLIECKKCTKQYIGETKRQLHERFGENRRSIQNHHQLIKPTPVSTHLTNLATPLTIFF